MREKLERFGPVLAGLVGIVILTVCQGVSYAETSSELRRTWGSFLVTGSVGTTYLIDDVSGDRNLFRSQFNLKEGAPIGEISFQAFRLPEKSGFFDVLSLDVRGFGAEPFGRAGFKLEKRSRFVITGSYTERKRFADVASFANPLFDPETEDVLFRSFHTWNTKEKTFELGAEVKLSSWLSLFGAWERTDIEGESLITLRLLNNEFPLKEPIDQSNTTARMGAEIRSGSSFFYRVSGVYQKFELAQTASSQENLGIRGLSAGSSEIRLSSQSRSTSVDIDAWAVTQSFRLVPFAKVTLEGHYTRNWTEGTSSGEENIKGHFVWPLYDFVSQASLTNTGQLEKDAYDGRFSVSYTPLSELVIRAGYEFNKYTIDTSDEAQFSFTRIYYNRTMTGRATFQPLIQLKRDRMFAESEFSPARTLAITAGYARSANDLGLREKDEAEVSETSYTLNSFYGSLAFRIPKKVSLKATVERGDYNRVFARLVPLEATTVTFQTSLRPIGGFSGSLFYKNQKLKNTKFGYSSSLNGYGGNLRYRPNQGPFGFAFDISRNDLSSSMEIFRYISAFFPLEDVSRYSSDTLHVSGGAWLRKGPFDLEGGYSYTRTKGTFPVTFKFPYMKAGWKVYAGLALIFDYRFYSQDQTLFKSQNYEAHLFKFGFRYTF